MSSNDAIMVRKLAEDSFEVRRIGCVDNLDEIDEMSGKPYIGGLVSKHDTENAAYASANEVDDTEYGIIFRDDSQDNKLVETTIKSCDEHNNIGIKCAHCGSPYLTERAGLQFHDHPPDGECIDEIYECDECCQYTRVIWKKADVQKLNRVVI